MRTSKIALMHIPKTGGTALADRIFEQTRADETFLFSFFGRDASRGGNRILVETLRKRDSRIRALLDNRHFLESRVITGHFSYDLSRLLDRFSLQFAAVLREPIDRCVSLLYQYSAESPSGCRFGIYRLSSKTRRTDAFWNEMAWILNRHRGQPIPGLFSHENIMLDNGICQMLGGARLDRLGPRIGYEQAVVNLPAFKLALFERFNETCGALMRELDLPVTLDDQTNAIGQEHPVSAIGHRPYHGAPAALLDLVRSRNEDDLRLYQHVADEHARATARTAR